MNTTTNTRHTNSTDDVDEAAAVARAEAGVAGWEDAVRLQRWARSDHADFYTLAGQIVATLNALDDLGHVLRRQVRAYGQGRHVYDDTRGAVDPRERLTDAAAELTGLIEYVQAAQAPANRFWSAIGHIGGEPRIGNPETRDEVQS